MTTYDNNDTSPLYRWTDARKWIREPMRSLSYPEKLVLLWIKDNCDDAGFIEINEQLIQADTKLSQINAHRAIIGLLKNTELLINNPTIGIVWIKDYIYEQRCEMLSLSNSRHRGIIAILRQRIPDFIGYEAFNQFISEYDYIFDEYAKTDFDPKNISQVSPKPKNPNQQTYNRYPGFLAFHSIYPNKNGKARAFRIWVERNYERISERINKALLYHTTTEQWTRDNGKYIPFISTYLYQARFDDVPDEEEETNSVSPVVETTSAEPDESFVRKILTSEFPGEVMLPGEQWKKWKTYRSYRILIEQAWNEYNKNK